MKDKIYHLYIVFGYVLGVYLAPETHKLLSIIIVAVICYMGEYIGSKLKA